MEHSCDLCSNTVTDSDNLLRFRGNIIHYQCWLNACKITGINPIVTVVKPTSPSRWRSWGLAGIVVISGIGMVLAHRLYKVSLKNS